MSEQSSKISLLKQRAEKISQELPALIAEAQRITTSIQQGVHGRQRKGMSETFWEFRDYQQEDDVQAIDWRRSARSDTLYIRENEWEASHNLWFWLDQRKGMYWQSSTQYPTKNEQALLILLVLAILLTKGGERIGLIGETPPRHGHTGLIRFVEDLKKTAQTYAHLKLLRSSYSHCLLITDGYDPLPKIEKQLQILLDQHVQGVFLQIYDPAEEDFPYKGRVQFESPAQTETYISGRSETLKAHYQERFKEHQKALKKMLQKNGLIFLTHRTDQPITRILIELYNVFNQNKKFQQDLG